MQRLLNLMSWYRNLFHGFCASICNKNRQRNMNNIARFHGLTNQKSCLEHVMFGNGCRFSFMNANIASEMSSQRSCLFRIWHMCYFEHICVILSVYVWSLTYMLHTFLSHFFPSSPWFRRNCCRSILFVCVVSVCVWCCGENGVSLTCRPPRRSF